MRLAAPRALGWLRARRVTLVVTLLGAAVVVGVFLAASVAFALAGTPARYANSLRERVRLAPLDELPLKDRLALERDLLQYEQYWADNRIKVGTTLVQVVGAIVLAAGGVVAWKNLRATQARLDVDREGQITNRFTQAISQLGAELKDGTPNLEVRLGGIYALERIARDSPRDHWTIMEVLTAYVRQNALSQSNELLEAERQTPSGAGGQATPLSPAAVAAIAAGRPRLRVDAQAVLTVLGRRDTIPETAGQRLDLQGADLRGAYLEGAHLEGAHLMATRLDWADLRGARLDWADLRGAHLGWANLWGAHLEAVHLMDAQLRRAWLVDARLQRAQLTAAHLDWADLGGAQLDWADLREAHLDRANLRGARLKGANLHGACLKLADLRFTIGLTQQQVAATHDMGQGALLPDDWPPDWRAAFREAAERPAAPSGDVAPASDAASPTPLTQPSPPEPTPPNTPPPPAPPEG